MHDFLIDFLVKFLVAVFHKEFLKQISEQIIGRPGKRMFVEIFNGNSGEMFEEIYKRFS